MAIVFRGAGLAAAGNNSATLTPGLPSGWQPGDLLLLFATARLGTAGFTAPAGWQLVLQTTPDGSRPCQTAIYRRIAQAGDVDPTVTHTNGAVNNTVIDQIFAFYNTAKGTSQVRTYVWSNNGLQQNIGPISALTPVRNDGMVLVFGAKADDWTSVGLLSGDGITWGEATETTSTLGTDAGFVLDYGVWSGAPPTITSKTFVVTGGTTHYGVGTMLEIIPAFVASGTLQGQAATLSGAGSLNQTGSGAAIAQAAVVAGSGAAWRKATGVALAQAAMVSGTGAVEDVATLVYAVGTGIALTSQSAAGAGTAERILPGTGSLLAQAATTSGQGQAAIQGTGSLTAEAATSVGLGSVNNEPFLIHDVGTTTQLVAQSSTSAGSGSVEEMVEATGTGSLVARQASLIGGVAGNAWDVGSIVSLIAQSAQVQTAGAVVVEDIGSPAELVAQSAMLYGTSRASKIGIGSLLGRPALVAGVGQPARNGTGDLLAQSAQVYGVFGRLILTAEIAIAGGSASVAATTIKVDKASGALLADAAETAASGAVQRYVADDLLSGAADLNGVGGHSTAAGPVGSGDLYPSAATITNTAVVAKVASGTLHPGVATVEASGIREITAFPVGLDAYPASLQVNIEAGDIMTWETDDAIWGQPPVIHARDFPVFPKENWFYQADFGSTFHKEPVRVLLERTGLTILGRDRQGNWKINQGVIKFVTGVWPFIKGAPGTQILVYVGSQMTAEEAITWEGPYTAIIGETDFIDFTVSGRYIAVRFESVGQQPWELISYDLDLTTVGER